MKYYSSNNKKIIVTFRQAVLSGLAIDGGLFLPEKIPVIDKSFLQKIKDFSFAEIGYIILSKFVEDEIEQKDLIEIINKSFNFQVPLIRLDSSIHILELFHGPTLAFKDFGARFMSNMVSHFINKTNTKTNILVATSGDTGSAVANGFYGMEGINVFLLYPKNKVSEIQEKQLTTLKKNIIALEIDGTFDDCQKIVKLAFLDKDINSKLNLSSANSINIARLLPQVLYYFEAYKQLPDFNKEVYFSVPSGNLGNLTGGLIAKKIGLPVSKFIAATNLNNVFSKYISSGEFIPMPSIKTISNAMDVGNPSNLVRISELFNNDLTLIRDSISSSSFSDYETLSVIKKVYEEYKYILDPHGAVGYLALEDYLKNNCKKSYNGIILETAHPAKFKDIVESSINVSIEMPKILSDCLQKEKNAIELQNDFNVLKDFLLSFPT